MVPVNNTGEKGNTSKKLRYGSWVAQKAVLNHCQ